MAHIILFTSANQQTGEPRKASALGYRPAQWCQDNLKLEPEQLKPNGVALSLGQLRSI